jgi:drug/metabolite transporter (DMT)-like permease
MSGNGRAAGAAAVTVVLWASAFVAIRSAGGHFSPGALALGRLLVASLALGVLWLISGDGWPPRAAWPGIAGSGVLWFGLYMITLNWGEREVGAGMAVSLAGAIVVGLSESGGGGPRCSGWRCAWWRRSATRQGWCSRSRPWATPRPFR